MNPNQMMLTKAMVAQHALRDEAQSRRAAGERPGPARSPRPGHQDRQPLPRLAADGDNRRVATRVSASRLIGRAAELAELEAAFDEAAGGRGLVGVPGGRVGRRQVPPPPHLPRPRPRTRRLRDRRRVRRARPRRAPLRAAGRRPARPGPRTRPGPRRPLPRHPRAGLAQLIPELDPDAAGRRRRGPPPALRGAAQRCSKRWPRKRRWSSGSTTPSGPTTRPAASSPSSPPASPTRSGC